MLNTHHILMHAVATLGGRALTVWRFLSYIVAVLYTVVRQALHLRYWGRVVQKEFLEQCYRIGNQAVWFVVLLAVLVGLGLVFQSILWLNIAGQSDLLGRFLVLLLVREIAPVLVNLIVIGRSGTAMTAELGIMAATGEVRALDAQGLDPFIYLVLPRVAAMVVSTCCLCVVFLSVSLASGYLFGQVMAISNIAPGTFINTVLKAMGPAEAVALPLKTLLPALITGVMCCVEGLRAKSSVSDVPGSLPPCFALSVTALFLVSAAVTLAFK